MYNHDPAPPSSPPLPDRPLDQLQIVEARHVLLHVAQQAQELRTTLGALYARSETRQLVGREKVQRGVQGLIDELEDLRGKLGGPLPADSAPRKVHWAVGGGVQCGRQIRWPILVTGYADEVTCRLCLRSLRAQEGEQEWPPAVTTMPP